MITSYSWTVWHYWVLDSNFVGVFQLSSTQIVSPHNLSVWENTNFEHWSISPYLRQIIWNFKRIQKYIIFVRHAMHVFIMTHFYNPLFIFPPPCRVWFSWEEVHRHGCLWTKYLLACECWIMVPSIIQY